MRMEYLVFAGESFYPMGGFDDYIGSFKSLKEAQESADLFFTKEKISDGWAHVVFDNKVIWERKIDDFFLEDNEWIKREWKKES